MTFWKVWLWVAIVSTPAASLQPPTSIKGIHPFNQGMEAVLSTRS